MERALKFLREKTIGQVTIGRFIMRAKWSVLLLSVLTAVSLAGCGGSGGSGGTSVSGPGDLAGSVEAVGADNCKVCHTAIFTAWESGVGHNNENTRPDNSYFGRDPADCATCHDPTGDSAIAGKPVVGCEGCHGGGSAHRGVGPIPYPYPDPEQCAKCHDAHGDSIGTAVLNSAHNNSDDLHAGAARCQRCHTAEGSVLFSRYTGDKDVMDSMDTDNVASLGAEEDLHAVTCVACHKPHDGSGRWENFIATNNSLDSGNWDPNGNGVADQFDFCTSCHTYYNQDGRLVGSGSAASGTAPFYHNTAWYRTVTTTHYDDPATGYGLTDNILEGYVIRTDSANPCFDCHGHELRTNTRRHLEAPTDADRGPTIHTDWANSRHGAMLLEAKVAADDGNRSVATVDAVMAAGREDGEGHGWSWTHYDWDATNRQSCQRCHTSTGVSNFLADPTTYDQTANDFSHLQGWGAGGTPSSGQNEMLYCWGCHVSIDTGELRDPGALTIDYSNSASVAFPDSAASNVCIACHSGRENGDSIKNDTDDDGVRSFINSHYLTAGGMVFATGGYEFDGKDYAFAANDRHQNIGYGSGTLTGDANFDAVSDDYTSGPCVTCHFNSSDVDGLNRSHTLSPFTETVADGTVLNSVCVVCHTSRGVGDAANTWFGVDFEEADFVAGVVAPHKGRMLGAQLALLEVLASKGILTDFSSYPYFFADSGFGGGIAGNGILEPGEVDRNNGFTNWAGIYGFAQWKNVMGAAFNLNLIAHDPGATAHNRRYARRLIYDSIDFMDDGLMNDSTSATVTAQAQPYTASALNYIGRRP
ncbi:MAG: C-type polyheme cytochrome OmcB [Desulfuromonadales bacterium]|nr:C-type polyheme cytochrome OmcB [Desulfuromonadales bacterium]